MFVIWPRTNQGTSQFLDLAIANRCFDLFFTMNFEFSMRRSRIEEFASQSDVPEIPAGRFIE